MKKVAASLNEFGREHSRYIEPQTLLLTNSGATLGVPKITLIGGCINDGVAALLGVGYPLKLYLLYFLRTQTERLRGVNQGAAQPNLNTTIIKAINVPLPPLAEQTRIVAEVERRLSAVDELESVVSANLQRATCLRQSILQKAFTGKLWSAFTHVNHRGTVCHVNEPSTTRRAVKRIERTFELSGPEGLGAKPRPERIGPVFTHLHDTLQDAVRMGFLHSSRARGRIPACLKAAAEVHYIGHSTNQAGATLLHFEVPTFGSVAGELFEQQLLWEDGPKPEQTAFELLGAALSDVRKRQRESNRFDRGMLQRVSSYRRILRRGIDHIGLPDTDLPDTGGIDQVVVEAASELCAATPSPRRVRVTGHLDLMAAKQAVLKLDIKEGVFVTAVWEGDQPVEALKDFFNRDVVIEGAGVFRPSGSLLRIDADAITFAGAQDEFFRQLPAAMSTTDYQVITRLRPGEKSPFGRILGSIPAEESDEEFAAAVEAFS